MQHSPLVHRESSVIPNPVQPHPILFWQCLDTSMPKLQIPKSTIKFSWANTSTELYVKIAAAT